MFRRCALVFDLEKLKEKEKVFLVGVELPGQEKEQCLEHLEELGRLAETAGLSVRGMLTQARPAINPAFFIGRGKVQEIKSTVESEDINLIIFDDELTPAQIRNLENVLKIKILDRSQLILDIFAQHARTRAAKTQVELAQLQYLLPRLTRHWTHLSRQVGGIGTRGPGETQLETDRRLIRNRIEKLKKDLELIDRQKSVQRKNRKLFFSAALVGYTNVGKSTLMNLLSGADVLVEDQLFATLDSTIRKVKLNENYEILISDTVGFIRKLPHHLIASFKSTLNVVREADILLHVVDISHPKFQEQMFMVMKVLEDLDIQDKPILTIFNKIDQLNDMSIIQSMKNQYETSVFISARRFIGIESLKKLILSFLEKQYIQSELVVPVESQHFINYLHETVLVEKQDYFDSQVKISFKCQRNLFPKIKNKYNQLHSKTDPE